MICGLVRLPGGTLPDSTSAALGGGSARSPPENAKSIAQTNHTSLNWDPGFFIRRHGSHVKK
jgi:hypothetical protein